MNRVDKLMLVECRVVIDPREDESRSWSELKLKLLRDEATRYMETASQLQIVGQCGY
jgi:hypothetical protein